MELAANAVVFVFDIERAGKGGEDLVLRVSRSCEHEFHRPEESESNFVELASFGEHGRLADVSENHICAPDRINRAIEGASDRFLDSVFLEPDAEVACNDLDDVFRFGGSQGAEEIQDCGHFIGSAGKFDEIGEFGLDGCGIGTLSFN